MTKQTSIKQFMQAIEKLPSDKAKNKPRIWYQTQKEHWLGWLREYGGPGAYSRKGGNIYGAKFAYNHIVCYQMLIWIIGAAGVDPKLVKKTKAVVDDKKNSTGKLWCDPKNCPVGSTGRCALERCPMMALRMIA